MPKKCVCGVGWGGGGGGVGVCVCAGVCVCVCGAVGIRYSVPLTAKSCVTCPPCPPPNDAHAHMTANPHQQTLPHDNAKPHKTRLTMADLNQQHNVLPWPALSPVQLAFNVHIQSKLL